MPPLRDGGRPAETLGTRGRRSRSRTRSNGFLLASNAKKHKDESIHRESQAHHTIGRDPLRHEPPQESTLVRDGGGGGLRGGKGGGREKRIRMALSSPGVKGRDVNLCNGGDQSKQCQENTVFHRPPLVALFGVNVPKIVRTERDRAARHSITRRFSRQTRAELSLPQHKGRTEGRKWLVSKDAQTFADCAAEAYSEDAA